MIDSNIVMFMAAIITLQVMMSFGFIARAAARGDVRVRFTLRSLFVLVTIVAVSFGIIRLPLTWPLKWLIVSGFLICANGLALARRPPFPGKPASHDRGGP